MALQALQQQDSDRDHLMMEDVAPAARFGAQRLIAAHLAGAPVDIKSWGTADTVYEEVTAKLIAYGVEQGIAQDFTRSLVDYAVEKASEFQSEHQAKIIALRVAVDEINPAAQFETGPIATFRLNGSSRQAQMASASGQNVRSTISGTATTTSDRSSVENVFKGVKEWSVWGKIEAPDKSELKQIAPDVVMAALAQMAAGELTPEEAATLQAQLEFLAAEGVLPPELADIARTIETMRMAMEGGMTPDSPLLQSMARQVAELITQGVEAGTLTPELARQVMESVAAFADANGLEQVFSVDMMQAVSAAIEWTAVTQALEQIMPHLGAADRAVIEAMLKNGEVPSAEALVEQLVVINEIIAQADLPEAMAVHIATIEGSLPVLQDIAQSQIEAAMPDAPSASVDLAALDAADIQAMIQALGDIDPAALTPEQAEILQALQEAMGTVDLATVTLEQIEAALQGEGDPALQEALQVMAASLSQPEMAALLPQDVQLTLAEAMPTPIEMQAADIAQMVQTVRNNDPASMTPEQLQLMAVVQEALGATDLAAATSAQIEAAVECRGNSVVAQNIQTMAAAVVLAEGPKEGVVEGSVITPPHADAPDVTADGSDPSPVTLVTPSEGPDMEAPPTSDKPDEPSAPEDTAPTPVPDEPPKPTPEEVKKPDVAPADNPDPSQPPPPEDKLSKPDVGPDGPADPCRYNCRCKDAFTIAVGDTQVLGSGLTIERTGENTFLVNGKELTTDDLKRIAEEERVITEEIDRTVTTQQFTVDELLKGGGGGSPDMSPGSGLRKTFHECGPGCGHGEGGKDTPSSPVVIEKISKRIEDGVDVLGDDIKKLMSQDDGWGFGSPTGP